jgi:hypothetical protein
MTLRDSDGLRFNETSTWSRGREDRSSNGGWRRIRKGGKEEKMSCSSGNIKNISGMEGDVECQENGKEYAKTKAKIRSRRRRL